jgi:hypothetical protein
VIYDILVKKEKRLQTALDLQSQLWQSLYSECKGSEALKVTLQQLESLLFIQLKKTQTDIEIYKEKNHD